MNKINLFSNNLIYIKLNIVNKEKIKKIYILKLIKLINKSSLNISSFQIKKSVKLKAYNK